MRFDAFLGASYTAQSPNADNQELINWYLERMESASPKAQFVMLPAPGKRSFARANEAPVRGSFEASARGFAVIGPTFYEINSDATLTNRGTVLVDQNPVTWGTNGRQGHQVIFSSGGTVYCYDLTSGVFTAVLVSNVGFVGFLDGYLLALDTTTSSLYISAFEDGTVWDPTQKAQRAKGADPWQSMLVSHGEIWLFGSETTEVWANLGTSPFPFGPNGAAGVIQQGIAAPYTACEIDNAINWVGQSNQGAGMLWRAAGYTPQRISTHPMEFALANYRTLTDASAFAYQENGHTFYCATFPSGATTWVWDAATGTLHKRGAWDKANAIYEPDRAVCHCYVFGKHLVGDRETGTIFEQSVNLYTDADGNGVRRLRRAPHLSNEQKWMFYSSLQVDFQAGIGLSAGQGSDPQAMLRFSDDGGRTWGAEIWVGIGKQGKYKDRALWQRLGAARDRVFEVVVSDPVFAAIAGAYLEVQQGTS